MHLPFPTVSPSNPLSSQNGKWKPCTTSIPLAELGSLHLEWMYLTAITGDTKYYKKVSVIVVIL